jgi:uncharacterized protein
MPLEADLLEQIVCPACKSELILTPQDRLYCARCRRSYPIRDEIPILLIDAATIEDHPPTGEE